MLTTLRIQNLILIEKAEIAFGPGLNILTGETGAGKSAVLAAIRLISGERADQQLIRKGANLAIVEATLSSISPSLLEEEGISPLHLPITIRRELHSSGKNRCFIEDAQVTLSTLKKMIGSAIERVDQSSSAALCSRDEQRNSLDIFANLQNQITEFSHSFSLQQEQEKKLEALLQSQMQRDRELQWAEDDLAAITEAGLQKGEEEKLAQEHHLLTHSQELLEKLSSISSAFSEGPQPLVPLLKRFSVLMENCIRFDPKIAPLAASIRNSALELEEVGSGVNSYLNSLESDPQRLEWIEARISSLESIKKRFGSTFEEIEKKKEALKAQIENLSTLEDQIDSLQGSLKEIRSRNLSLSSIITDKRKAASTLFAKSLLAELKSLNLPHAEFQISIEAKPLSANGCDEIKYLFSANPGTPPIPLEQCASGGELSRLLLAMKTTLAEKEGCPCLIFDEIDSNVGGQTAAILGEKLKKLSNGRQVICVTHFVQVAKCAGDHFLVSKAEREGHAYTSIAKLSLPNKEIEYQRMLGTV